MYKKLESVLDGPLERLVLSQEYQQQAELEWERLQTKRKRQMSPVMDWI